MEVFFLERLFTAFDSKVQILKPVITSVIILKNVSLIRHFKPPCLYIFEDRQMCLIEQLKMIWGSCFLNKKEMLNDKNEHVMLVSTCGNSSHVISPKATCDFSQRKNMWNQHIETLFPSFYKAVLVMTEAFWWNMFVPIMVLLSLLFPISLCHSHFISLTFYSLHLTCSLRQPRHMASATPFVDQVWNSTLAPGVTFQAWLRCPPPSPCPAVTRLGTRIMILT